MIKLAIFDLDGTVFESFLDWKAIREKLGLQNKNILKEIFAGSEIDTRRLHLLEKYEKENTRKTQPIAGIKPFLGFLESKGVVSSLITNNSQGNTRYLLKKFQINFSIVVTREMKFWKPSPDAFLYLLDTHACRPDEAISIGDSHYDIMASSNAKIPYIFIKKSKKLKMEEWPGVDYFDNYFNLKETIETRFFPSSS